MTELASAGNCLGIVGWHVCIIRPHSGKHIVLGLGEETSLVKMDVEHAYRNAQMIVATRWNKLYVDIVLSFELHLAPMIFSAVTDTAEWIAVENGLHP